jgi:hypothetical protein
MKKIVVVSLLAGSFSGLFAEARANLFHIKRNKNKNEVHYAVRYDEKTCKPVEGDAVYGYWLNLEIGPNSYEPIGRFERIAYGISSQEVKGDDLMVQLKAFPDRAIRVNFSAAGGCKISAHVAINGQEAKLKHIYVFAEEGLIKPTVKYVDIIGSRGGTAVTERINR